MPATKLAFRSRPTLASATPSFIDGCEAEELEQAIYGKIRERAYLLFAQPVGVLIPGLAPRLLEQEICSFTDFSVNRLLQLFCLASVDETRSGRSQCRS